MKYGELTLGQIEAVVNKLGGMDAVSRLLSGDLVLQEVSFFREMEKLAIQIPALPRPTLKELKEKFSWIKSIKRDTSPTEAVTFTLATILRSNENKVSGAEYERRISPKLDLVLGYPQAVWLVEHQDELPDFMALLGKIYIDFSGLVVVVEHGVWNVPALDQNGTRWRVYWPWLRDDFDQRGRIALSRK